MTAFEDHYMNKIREIKISMHFSNIDKLASVLLLLSTGSALTHNITTEYKLCEMPKPLGSNLSQLYDLINIKNLKNHSMTCRARVLLHHYSPAEGRSTRF